LRLGRVDGRNATKNNHLTTYTWDDAKESREKPQDFDLTLGADHITMNESNGTAEIHLERVCKSGSAVDHILGEWFSPNYLGSIPVFRVEVPLRFPAFVEFTRDKRVFFPSTPVKSTHGQSELLDGMLALKLPSEPPLKSKPHVSSSSDQTGIRVATKGPEIPFRRVSGSGFAAQHAPSKQPYWFSTRIEVRGKSNYTTLGV
jgi:hypothetical protein